MERLAARVAQVDSCQKRVIFEKALRNQNKRDHVGEILSRYPDSRHPPCVQNSDGGRAGLALTNAGADLSAFLEYLNFARDGCVRGERRPGAPRTLPDVPRPPSRRLSCLQAACRARRSSHAQPAARTFDSFVSSAFVKKLWRRCGRPGGGRSLCAWRSQRALDQGGPEMRRRGGGNEAGWSVSDSAPAKIAAHTQTPPA